MLRHCAGRVSVARHLGGPHTRLRIMRGVLVVRGVVGRRMRRGMPGVAVWGGDRDGDAVVECRAAVRRERLPRVRHGRGRRRGTRRREVAVGRRHARVGGVVARAVGWGRRPRPRPRFELPRHWVAGHSVSRRRRRRRRARIVRIAASDDPLVLHVGRVIDHRWLHRLLVRLCLGAADVDAVWASRGLHRRDQSRRVRQAHLEVADSAQTAVKRLLERLEVGLLLG
mmetsp:Transcript_8179/g.25282  ORF Transcript_8179/g.25282 Transcript_8179/m.25282 type:complete len:226 (+) Transcript_8179:701-1378(+)